MNAPEVRPARVQLARALSATAGGAAEAERQLRRALEDEGPRPGEWEIRLDLALLFERARGDVAAAVVELLRSVLAATAADQERPAGEALRLLGAEGAAPAGDVPDELVEQLAAAQEAEPTPAGTRLAAHLLLRRGALDHAYGLIRRFGPDEFRSDRAVYAARLVFQARHLLDAYRVPEADQVLDQIEGIADDPAALATRAMCRYVEGRTADAAGELAGAPSGLDVRIVSVLVWLRLAARAAGADEPAGYLDRARRAATRAARSEPTRAEPLLLRAQVLLEGAGDLAEGRRLLRRGLERLDGPPEQLWWWRLQDRCRADDLYRVVAVEVAAALGRDDELVERAGAMSFAATRYAQDAAVRELWAAALARGGDETGAIEVRRRAARDLAAAGDAAGARRTLREIVLGSGDPDAGLELVDQMWTATFEQTPDEALATLREAVELLDTVDDRAARTAPAWACLLRGLVRHRQLTLAGPASTVAVWDHLPALLLAVEADPGAAYAVGHVAWALSDCALSGPADLYARRALDASPDPWLRVTAVMTGFVRQGRLDDRIRSVLDGIRAGRGDDDAEPWETALRAYAALLDGGSSNRSDALPVDDLWLYRARTLGRLRDHGRDGARPDTDAYLVECRRLRALGAAAEVAALVAPDEVDDLVAAGREVAEIGDRDARTVHTLLRIVRASGPVDLDPMLDDIARTTRPFTLRDLQGLVLPAAAAVGGAPEELDRLAEAARVRLAELEGRPVPLVAEIDSGEAWCTVPAVADVVRTLLVAAEAAMNGERAAARAGLQFLGTPTAGAAVWTAALRLVLDRLDDDPGAVSGS